IMTVNILYALPNTALYRRLESDGRILSDEESANLDSNIRFLPGYEEVVRRWLKVIDEIYQPEVLYMRYDYNAAETYPHRFRPTQPWQQATLENLWRGLSIFGRLIWKVGLASDYRWNFWKMGLKQLRQGNVDTFFQVAMVAHPLITYARECLEGKLQASNYSKRASGPTEQFPNSRSAPNPKSHELADVVSLRTES